MTTEIEITNFQSIEHAQVVVKGYTSVVGRSNIGKSAIIRAVKAALTGAAGSSFVRHGPNCTRRLKDAKRCHCKASVRIKREGFDLLWEKGDYDNTYTFNGAVYDSVERGTPYFLMQEYAPIKIGDERELLQVADQFDPIFLLNRTGGVVADVLSDVAHLDRINTAMRMVERDRRDAVSTRKIREQDVVTLTEKLVRFDGLDDAVSRVREVSDQLKGITAKSSRLLQLEKFMADGAARGTEIRRLMGVDGVVLPDPSSMKSTADGFQRFASWLERLIAFKAMHKRAKVVEAAGVPEFGGLREAYARCSRLDQAIDRLAGLESEVSRLETAHVQAEDAVSSVRAEWADLGVCPTCEQTCSGHGPV